MSLSFADFVKCSGLCRKLDGRFHVAVSRPLFRAKNRESFSGVHIPYAFSFVLFVEQEHNMLHAMNSVKSVPDSFMSLVGKNPINKIKVLFSML